MEREIRPYIEEIRTNLIEKLTFYKPFKVSEFINQTLEPKLFRTHFEVSDFYKQGRKLKPQYRELIYDLQDTIKYHIKHPEKVREIFSFLSPRMDTLITIVKRELPYEEYKFEYELYQDIVYYLFNKNKGLALNEARKIKVNDFPMVEIEQYAYIGLLKGIRRFNWSAGFKLTTFATYWIRESIYKAVNQNFTIKYPEQVRACYREILKLSREYDISLHSLDVDKVIELKPELLKKFSKDLIYDALTIDWVYSIDYAETTVEYEDDRRNLILDKYAIKTYHSVEENIVYDELIELVSTILTEEELSIFIQEFSLDKCLYIDIPAVNYNSKDVNRVINRIKSEPEIMNKIKEVLYG